MKTTPEAVTSARGNLINLRDDAFFDKLKQAFDIEPMNDRERFSLVKMADDLQTAEERGLIQTDDRFATVAKTASDYVSQFSSPNDEDALIDQLAIKIAADNPALVESAAVFFTAVAEEE